VRSAQGRALSVRLVVPTADNVADCASALERGWQPDPLRGAAASAAMLAKIRDDPAGYAASRIDREARGGPIPLPDGSPAERLPCIQLWIYLADAFAGTIAFRWRPGTAELPPHVLGHIGYAVVPWTRGRGCARAALRAMLDHPRGEGLPYVEITTDADNLASRRVIEANGGVLFHRFTKPAAFGGRESLRYRIVLEAGVA